MANAVCHIITRRLCTLEGQALRCARFSVSPLRHYPHITRDYWRRFKAHERAGLCQHGADEGDALHGKPRWPRSQMVDFQRGAVEGSQASTRVPNHGRAVAVDFERVFETGEACALAVSRRCRIQLCDNFINENLELAVCRQELEAPFRYPAPAPKRHYHQ